MMKRMIFSLLIAVPALAFAETTTWDTVKSYTVDRKKDAVAFGKKLVRDTDREIKELDRKAAKTSGEAKAQFQSDVKELRVKRAEAARKLDEMGKASGAAWEDAKNGFADAYKDLHDSYDKAVKKLK